MKPMIALTGLALAFAMGSASAAKLDSNSIRIQAKNFFQPLPSAMPGSENDTPEKIALGEKLYFETALSVNGTQSCNTCHRLDEGLGGVDNLALSPGAPEGTIGGRNSPTTWNAGFHFVQFWDGRAPDLKEQAKGPLLNPVEMAMPDEASVIAAAKKAGYEAEFNQIFGQDGLTFDNLAEAIAAFERTLITEDRFDAFLKGEDNFSQQELAGLKAFVDNVCTMCHSGPLLGGQMYQKMGLMKPYPNQDDQGRFDVTGNAADRMMFKVPSLRNISQTAPFFHDGAVETLEEAVVQMADYQLNRKLDEETTANIVAFLKTLDNQREFKRVTE